MQPPFHCNMINYASLQPLLESMSPSRNAPKNASAGYTRIPIQVGLDTVCLLFNLFL